jgi:hypothetical protein
MTAVLNLRGSTVISNSIPHAWERQSIFFRRFTIHNLSMSHSFSSLSLVLTVQLRKSDSMVEIKREGAISMPLGGAFPLDEDRYRLVYSKSKVYVNPTAYARDNIPGFVALVKRVRLFCFRF